MTTSRRAGRTKPVDLMFGGDEAEALFEAWLGEQADDAPPVRVEEAKPVEPPPTGDAPEPQAWRPPAMRAPVRRPR